MKQILTLFLGLFIITLVSATSIGEFQLGQDVELYQTCNNCTGCNLSRVMGLNNRVILSNVEMIQDGTYYSYNISANNFTTNGDYQYCYDCGNAVERETGCIDFKITYNGINATEQMTSTYGYSFLILGFLFALVLFISTRLPAGDSKDEDGSILHVSMLKHLRPVCFGVAWSIILAIIFLVGNMTLAYLPNSLVGDLFTKLFIVMFGLTLVALPLWMIWIFTGIFRDKEYRRMIERGVDINSTF